MDILTNGSRFAHADVDRPARQLRFLLPAQPEGEPRHWWGRLERGDEVALAGPGPRIELLDEAFRPLTDDLHRPLRVRRSGVVHLRIHGNDPIEVRVTRLGSRFPHDAAASADRRPLWTFVRGWVRHGLGLDRAAARRAGRAIHSMVAGRARPSLGKSW